MRLKSPSIRKLKLLQDLKIGVLCGGSSSERAISLISGRAVLKALKSVKLDALLIDPSHRNFKKKIKSVDLAFIALHGTGGEDGEIQSLLSRLRIPFTGSGAQASRRTFNKASSKRIFSQSRISTPPYRIIKKKTKVELKLSLSGACFVKPTANGSSVGVFRIEDFAQNAVKVSRALKKYGDLLIEQAIEGREFTVGILGGKALPVIELIPKRRFYDYKAKYTKGMTTYKVPAPISLNQKKRMQKLALRVHSKLGLRDFSRVDFMCDEKGKPYVLEANTIPGLTELSLLPKAARAIGISFEKLCVDLLVEAWDRRN